MKKYKSTGCARFFIFLIIFAPLAFFGSAYINGEDGVQKIKDLIGIESTSKDKDIEVKNRKTEEEKLREENEKLKKQLEQRGQDN